MTIEIKNFGKITASKRVLNLLSCMAFEAAERNQAKGYEGLEEMDERVRKTIYDALDAIGYYDDVK